MKLRLFSVIDVFQQFLDEEFDAKAHATRAITGMAISAQLAKLAEGIAVLDKNIHSQVSSNLKHVQ